MSLALVNGNIVTGDGETLLERASVITQDEIITRMPKQTHPPHLHVDTIIDAEGGYIIPGITNVHAHGITFGPLYPFAYERFSEKRIVNNLDKHLLQGTTTILNLDGFATPWEVEVVNKMHPMRIKTATTHMPAHFEAMRLSGAPGMEEKHWRMTAEEMVLQGAVAIGESGCPGSTYCTIEKKRILGRDITVMQAMALDKAVLENGSPEKISEAISQAGLDDALTVEDAAELVQKTSGLLLKAADEGLKESVIYSKKLGVPVLGHNASDCTNSILQTAEQLGSSLTACHSNHTYAPEEACAIAKKLRKLGAWVEILSGDPFGARQMELTPDVTFAMMEEDLVDIITTDFIAGYHDAILLVLQKALEAEVIRLPQAIALATSQPARAIPRIAPHRGLLKPGNVADVCIVDKDDISKVRYVIIGGRVVVDDGRIVRKQV